MSRAMNKRRKDTPKMSFIKMFQHDMDQGDADILYSVRHAWQEKLFDLTTDEMIQILTYKHQRSSNLNSIHGGNRHIHNDRKQVEWYMFYFLLDTFLEYYMCWPELLSRIEIKNGQEYCQFRFPGGSSVVVPLAKLSEESRTTLKNITKLARPQ